MIVIKKEQSFIRLPVIAKTPRKGFPGVNNR